MPYSNSGGGTLTLQSPTHVHHVDVTSAVRSLSRSISRSPSKLRLVTKSPSPSSKSSLTSPKQLILNSSFSTAVLPGNTPRTPSPLAVPFPPSVKLALRSSSRIKPSPYRPVSRNRASPKSPIKRAQNRAIDTGNVQSLSNNEPLCTNDNTSNINSAELGLGGESTNKISPIIPLSSPLKRSDAIMNLDQASLGSPVAKRRSLHGSANFGNDFNIFDHGPSSCGTNDESNQEIELFSSIMTPDNPIPSLPKRSSSLRRSTLQQRHGEKTSWGRRHAAHVLAAQQAANTSTNDTIPQVPNSNHTKNRPRLSLDQFMPPLSRDSVFSNKLGLANASSPIINQPHPLSRTMTNTSSGSNNVDESPTLESASYEQPRRPKLDFSKSLPAGALRPFKLDIQSCGEDSFSTPRNYKSVKPLPAAFASTGLISKVNRNPEQQSIHRATNKSNVPDTPCKKNFNGYATHPAAVPGSAIAKARHIRHSFGTPSTPFNLHGNTGSGSFGHCKSVFGSSLDSSDTGRRGSFISLEGDESTSPESKCDIHLMADVDLPPTPTKQAIASQQGKRSPSNNRSSPKSSFHNKCFRRLSRQSISPLERTQLSGRMTPKTPQDLMAPPDASGLSISNHFNSQISKSAPVSMLPPATPTTGRDYHIWAKGGRPFSTTPSSTFALSDVDDSLKSKFEKVEMIGTGEFSLVYRVTGKSPPQRISSPIFPTTDRVFAVKKSRHPFQGVKDRERKFQEVNVLRALGNSDHVIHLLDTWENKNHLYIQTEYCEEGSMDIFLSQVGRKGRLDDFRIWKILLELSLGLKHIHDVGFIHLDLKPANVLITFEGVLKIADFGMATSWPAQPGIEGEGDREYIGPEILEGIYDKPADVFALGLMMLEIAGNVQLPDNGPTWQRLRSGDVSDVPSLTWSSDTHTRRDATGIPVDENELVSESFGSDDESETEFGSPSMSNRKKNYSRSCRSLSHDPSNLFGSMRRGELPKAPSFMTDMYHQNSLDQLVRWMISPNPQHRPAIQEILDSEGVIWVGGRRRAGATVYEGNWGPADDILSDDITMTDV